MLHHQLDRRPRRAGAGLPHWRRVITLTVAVALVGTACSSSDDAAGTTPDTKAATDASDPSSPSEPAAEDWAYPGAEWDEVEPGTAGFDPAGLDSLAADAEAAGSSCMVVTRDGAVVDERYWQDADAGTVREAFSVTKSITSVLTGIAQDEGSLALDDSASMYVPEWEGTPAEAVTVQNLLSNDSGREWSLGIDYGELIAAPDKTAFGVGLDQPQPPGEVWAYNNSAIQTLDAVLAQATGEEPRDFARDRLFDPIGMDDSEMITDAAGNTLTFMGLQTTCLDLARFGYLMLRDGRWEGEQVVSSAYVDEATGRSSTELNAGYGYLWWLNRRGQLGSPTIAATGEEGGSTPEGQMVPGVPDDVYWALGLFDQMVAVIPSEGIVAVRMGDEPSVETPFSQAELTTGVLDALTD